MQNFINHLHSVGIRPTTPLIGDSKLHRSHVEGDRAGTKNLAYIFHDDNKPVGWFLHFSTGNTGTWSASGKREPFTPEQRKQIEYAKEIRHQELEARHSQAAKKAQCIWAKAAPAIDHPYLTDKRIKPHGARINHSSLVIPLHNQTGILVNLQFIQEDGTKRFLSGGQKKGCYHLIGDITDKLLICEGFATGASLHENTGKAVVVAFDAGNLESVALAIRAKYLKQEIIICGDNDESGVGQQATNRAALSSNAKVLIPPIVGLDFNDYLNLGGVI